MAIPAQAISQRLATHEKWAEFATWTNDLAFPVGRVVQALLFEN